MSGMNIDWWLLSIGGGVFSFYSLVLFYIGYQGWERGKSVQDFIIGDGSFKGWWVGISFGATYASANMFLGVPALGYTYGTAALWWTTLGFGLPFLSLIILTKRIYRNEGVGKEASLTLPEWVGQRYKSSFLRFATGVVSLFLIFYVAGQLVGAATLIERVFGFPYTVGVSCALLLVVVYVSAGGMYSTIMTDFVQALMMSCVALFASLSLTWVFEVRIIEIPGQIITELETVDPTLTTPFSQGSVLFGGPVALVSISWLLFVFVLLPHLLNRLYTLNGKAELRRFLLSAGGSLWIMSSFMIWIGLAGRTLFPTLSHPDAVVPRYIFYAFPEWAAVIILIGILSATLTTADSLLHALGSIIVNDIFPVWMGRLSSRELDDYSEVWLARGGIIITGLCSYLIATSRPNSLFLLTQIGITGLLSGLAIPILAGYVWSDIPRKAAEGGFLTGSFLYLALFPTGIMHSQFIALAVASIGNLIVFASVSLISRTNKLLSRVLLVLER